VTADLAAATDPVAAAARMTAAGLTVEPPLVRLHEYQDTLLVYDVWFAE